MASFTSLWPSDTWHQKLREIWVNNGSGNCLFPYSTHIHIKYKSLWIRRVKCYQLKWQDSYHTQYQWILKFYTQRAGGHSGCFTLLDASDVPTTAILVLPEDCGATNLTTFLLQCILFYWLLLDLYYIIYYVEHILYICMYSHISFLIHTYGIVRYCGQLLTFLYIQHIFTFDQCQASVLIKNFECTFYHKLYCIMLSEMT